MSNHKVPCSRVSLCVPEDFAQYVRLGAERSGLSVPAYLDCMTITPRTNKKGGLRKIPAPKEGGG